MIELTAEQLKVLKEQGYPPLVRNPETQETYVLLYTEAYERVREILEDQDEIASIREMYPLMGRVLDERENRPESA